MKITTVREFRDKATGLLKSTEPVLITRRGRMAGIFFPSLEGAFPLDLKRELFEKLSAEIAGQIAGGYPNAPTRSAARIVLEPIIAVR